MTYSKDQQDVNELSQEVLHKLLQLRSALSQMPSAATNRQCLSLECTRPKKISNFDRDEKKMAAALGMVTEKNKTCVRNEDIFPLW